MIRAHQQWIEKSLEVLHGDRNETDFSGITMAIPSAKFDEAVRRIRDFRRSLGLFLCDETSDFDEVARLNIQFFVVRPQPTRQRACED
ncbi:MAG: DUF4423 domain-containing protein [Proteobacteria bacterium]|nr:MAG: DUF4423 domain-containing protein [Pseudomonadota bacterium]